MLRLIRAVFKLFSKKQRQYLLKLQFLIAIVAILEVVTVVSVGGFVTLVSNAQSLEQFSKFLDWPWEQGMLVILTGLVIGIFLVCSSGLSIYSTWKVSLFSSQVGAQIGSRLFSYYLRQPWLFHANLNSSEMMKRISGETLRLSDGVITPIMNLNARLVVVFFLLVTIIVYNPVIALTMAFILGATYFVIYSLLKQKLSSNSVQISKAMSERYKYMSEGFGGIKELLLYGRVQDINHSFQQTGDHLGRCTGTNVALYQIPRYVMELLAYVSLILIIIMVVVINENSFTDVLPSLAVYGIAGLKLLPALQQVYVHISTIRGNSSSYEALKDDLNQSQAYDFQEIEAENPIVNMDFNRELEMKHAKFSYPGKDYPAVDIDQLVIPAYKTVGFVGESGAGKSTIIDLVTGLVDFDQGGLYVDGVQVSSENKREWQNQIGLVPQFIFIADATLKENVAFGVPSEMIDHQRVLKAIKLAQLDKVVANLDDGIETVLGEKGVKLSGGQRQRVGIARALYNDPQILVFDEATSALDGMTEQLILDSVKQFTGQKTILIVAHRIKTIEECDVIYVMEKGKIVDYGSYQHLLKHSVVFKKLAQVTIE